MKFYRLDPFLCANKTCLIRLRYDKRFGGKTELNLIEQEQNKPYIGANLINLLG
jgi:hypothetical protein